MKGFKLVPETLIARAIEALTRHLSLHAPMQIPVSENDSDLVREDLRHILLTKTPPQPIYDEAVNAAVLGAQNLNAAMATIDILRAQLAERDALLTDLGVEPDGVSDVYQRLLLNAERYEYLREHMAVENFPSEHPDWSQPSEYESRRIDELCDSAMSRAKAGEVSP